MPRKTHTGFRVASVGLEMGVAMAIGLIGGIYVDEWLDTKPIFLSLGFVLGFGAAIKALVDAAKMMGKGDDKDGHTPQSSDKNR